MSVFKNITVIVNPISGGRKDKQALLTYLTDFFCRNGSSVNVRPTTKRGDATDFAVQAAAERNDLVVVVGGDGTINEVGAGLSGTDVVMGVIPIGSGNGLARTLNIPRNFKRACELICEGRIVEIDVGKANEHFFLLVAGVGFDAAVGKRFDEFRRRGPLAYFYVAAREFLQYKPEAVKVSFDDKSLEIKPFLVAVANGQQYGNNAIIAPDAKLNDGLLDITIIHHAETHELFTALPRLFSGKLKRYPAAEFYQAKHVTIERDQPAWVNIDGEPVLDKPVVDISVLPKSLKIIAPKNNGALS